MSFTEFQQYLNEYYDKVKPGEEYKGNISANGDVMRPKAREVYTDIAEDMKFLVAKSFESTRSKLNPANRKFCFEVFGFDFILDQDFTTWLIEVNTNPCLEESSGLLKTIIPRMLDDAFKLTIDRVFPPPARTTPPTSSQTANGFYERKQKPAARGAIYSVPGYSDSENLFEKVW